MVYLPCAPIRADEVKNLHRSILAAFATAGILWLGSLLQFYGPAHSGWLAAMFLVLASAATLISLAQNLPMQNVLGAAATIAIGAGVAAIIDAKSGVPFGVRTYTEESGPQWLGVSWAIPFIWIVVILNSRGVARLMLRPWRKLSRYGFHVIGLTAALAVVFDLSLEPFAAGIGHYWIWWTTRAIPAWHTAPFYNFLAWLVVTLLILAFATPWLIDKNPHRKSAPDYHPLIIWLALVLLLAAACARAHVWSAAGESVIAAIAVAYFAMRGARW